MRILLLSHSFNSLTQRLWVELEQAGHDISLELDINDPVTIQAVELARPDVVIAPFLKRSIPEAVWSKIPCLIVHPGPPGDRGPSALDWAILDGAEAWGVTVLLAEARLDAGPVLAHRIFPLRPACKSSIYRNEVTEAAVDAVMEALQSLDRTSTAQVPERSWWNPPMKQAQRAIDWDNDDTETVLRKIRASDGVPGVLDGDYYLHDAHPADGLEGEPGQWIARRGHMVARATNDGAVWIGQMRARSPQADRPDLAGLKLPAAMVLGDRAECLPAQPGHHDIWYDERQGVGYLHFPVHNGALGTDDCHRLRDAFIQATSRPTRVIVLMGGQDFWCNGIHLGLIEHARSPADESWANINAMDDLCQAIIQCQTHLTVSAMAGNAGAGGVFLALCADVVVARTGIVLNPHYQSMGNLYGSEYWTYLLPRRVGEDNARRISQSRLPMGTAQATELGLIDAHYGPAHGDFRSQLDRLAQELGENGPWQDRIATKRLSRLADEAEKPLDIYRAEELARMRLNFYGFDPSYHVARWNFIRKTAKSRTPLYLATHRSKP